MNKTKTVRPSNSYEEGLLKALKDPEEAAEYLNASLEEAIESDNIQIFSTCPQGYR